MAGAASWVQPNWAKPAWVKPSADWTGTASNSLDLDSTLVERCLTGDANAWEDLVRTHTRRVYGLCYRFTGRDSEAQDLTQDVFLRVFRALGSFRSAEGCFTTWLTRLTRNLLIDHYRRTRNQRVTDSIEEQLPRVEQGFVSVELPVSVPGAGRPVRCCRRRWAASRPNCARRLSCGICRRWNIRKSRTCWIFPREP